MFSNMYLLLVISLLFLCFAFFMKYAATTKVLIGVFVFFGFLGVVDDIYFVGDSEIINGCPVERNSQFRSNSKINIEVNGVVESYTLSEGDNAWSDDLIGKCISFEYYENIYGKNIAIKFYE